jgi:hypothetical protein
MTMDHEFVILVIAAFVLVALAMAAMAIGVIFRRPCLKGSCGGVGACACAEARGEK